MLRKLIVCSLLVMLPVLAGCGFPVKGPRFWWNDQQREKLPDDYMLPEAPPKTEVIGEGIPYHIKGIKDNEPEKATEEERAQQQLGIPRVTSQNPDENRVQPGLGGEIIIDDDVRDGEEIVEEEGVIVE